MSEVYCQVMATARDIIQRFGAVESDQRYGGLLEVFTDDAVYCDPIMGVQSGRDQIASFMAEMEKVVPKMGIVFDDWVTVADSTVGWATWNMVVPTDSGPIPVPGQSLYRLRDGKVCYVADYLDSRVFAKVNPQASLDFHAAARASKGTTARGPAADLVRTFWSLQNSARYSELAALFTQDAVFTDQVYGRFEGHSAVSAYLQRMETEMPEGGMSFSLVDHAGDDSVAWSQWLCHMPGGDVPGWTLHTVRDGLFTLDADYFDVLAARAASRNDAR